MVSKLEVTGNDFIMSSFIASYFQIPSCVCSIEGIAEEVWLECTVLTLLEEYTD